MNSEITEQTQSAAQAVELLPPAPDARALNSMQHGMTSQLVPLAEREGYAAHVLAVRTSTGATTYLEQRLSDRAALALWRLDRVARWESQKIETDTRRWHDRQQEPDPFAALLASQAQGVPIDARDLRSTLEALGALTGESGRSFLTYPETATLYATDTELEADGWAVLESGGDLATLSENTVAALGVELLKALMTVWNVSTSKVGRVLLGRKPTAAEVQSLENWRWEVEPGELPGLLQLCRQVAGSGWATWAMYKRYEASGKAGKIRKLAERLPMLVQQDQARAVEPDTKHLEKIMRYEAHLERVLYRALHELEAARRERQGQDTPGPLRVVLDERADG